MEEKKNPGYVQSSEIGLLVNNSGKIALFFRVRIQLLGAASPCCCFESRVG